MTNLEIVLSAAEIGTLLALVRSYRKQLIIRNVFIRYSDWCADKIKEVAEFSSDEIIEKSKYAAKVNGYEMSDDEARRGIPDPILDAADESIAMIKHLQGSLRKNGIAQLGAFDLDGLVFNPGLAGYKSVPLPQRRKWF